jgi:hypothetical protein
VTVTPEPLRRHDSHPCRDVSPHVEELNSSAADSPRIVARYRRASRALATERARVGELGANDAPPEDVASAQADLETAALRAETLVASGRDGPAFRIAAVDRPRLPTQL